MARLELRVLDERVTVDMPDPPETMRLDELLPFLRDLDDRVIGVAVRKAQADGFTVSCRRGCSACCRAQPVPITPAEAYALALLVTALPQPRKATILARFAKCVEDLRETDLYDCFFGPREQLSQSEARHIAQRYMQLRLACPFLEDDACRSTRTDRWCACSIWCRRRRSCVTIR